MSDPTKEETTRLEAQVLEGLASHTLPLNEAFIQSLKEKAEAVLAKHTKTDT